MMMFGIALAQEVAAGAAQAAPVAQGLLESVLAKIPAETIAWVLAIIALLNGISIGLDKIASLTKTDKDDKVAKVLHTVLNWLRWVVDFVVAKGKKADTKAVKDDAQSKDGEAPKA